jgi:hypothetical protein
MSIEAPSHTPLNNETPLDDHSGEQLEFDYNEAQPAPLDTDDELSSWEKLHQLQEINNLEAQFAAPETTEPGAEHEDVSALHEDILSRFRYHLENTKAEKIPVSSPESVAEPVVIKTQLGETAFQATARHDDAEWDKKMAREQASSVKEKVKRGIEKVQSTEYDGIVLEKAKEKLTEVKERFLAAKTRTEERIAHKREIRERAQNIARIQRENEAATQEQIQEKVADQQEKTEQEGREIARHRKPGFFRRIGRAVARYARNSKAYVQGVHEAGKANVRAQNESIHGIHVEA